MYDADESDDDEYMSDDGDVIGSKLWGRLGHVLSWGTFCQLSFLDNYPV